MVLLRLVLSLSLIALFACGGSPKAPAVAPSEAEAAARATASSDPPASAPPELAPLDPALVARLAAADHATRSNGVPKGKTQRYGHAEIFLHAPLPRVRKVITDFAHYKDIVPRKFHNARVVAKESGRTDLYMQIPIMHGMITLWDILRFGPTTLTSEGEVLEGTFVRGNVKDANLVLRMRAVDASSTILVCDLLILPKVPAPQSAIDEELRDAAGDALDGIKLRLDSEGKDAPPPPPASPPPAPA